MQLEICKIGQPDQAGKVLHHTIIHETFIAITPDLGCLHPLRAIRGAILLVKMKLVYAFGIAFESEGTSGKVRQEHRRNAHEIINDLALGETYRGEEDFIQIGKLDLTAFNFDARFLFSHRSAPKDWMRDSVNLTVRRSCVRAMEYRDEYSMACRSACGLRDLGWSRFLGPTPTPPREKTARVSGTPVLAR